MKKLLIISGLMFLLLSCGEINKNDFLSSDYLKTLKENQEERAQNRVDYLYNPPCAFSKFTTCLFPPSQNQLPIKIEAGERIEKAL